MNRQFSNYDGDKNPLKSLFVGGMALLSAVYIINPTFGLFELLPDNLPFIGNLDEAGAVMLLLNCLKYFDIDLLNLFQKREKKEVPVYEPPQK